MKLNKILLLTATLLGLVACSPSQGGLTPPPALDPENHTCVFDQQVIAVQYRATPSSCGHPATYYYSCVCGAKGTETFEDGHAKAHTYQVQITNYKAQYLVGESFDGSSVEGKILCEKCDYEKAIETKDVTVPTTPLGDTESTVDVVVNTGDSEIVKTLTISTDVFRVDTVDIYLKGTDNKVMFSVSGVYGDGYKSSLDNGEFYLAVRGDAYKFASAKPVTTPASGTAGYGTFKAEVDITDVYFSPKDQVIGTLNTDFVYWPHLIVGGEDKDLRFMSLETKEITRPGDPSGEGYALTLYSDSATNKYIPVVARTTTNAVPTFTYHKPTSADPTFPTGVTTGYMPLYHDIENVDDKAIVSFTFKFIGYTREVDLFRTFSMYFYKYTGYSDASKYYYSYDGSKTNHQTFENDFVVTFDNTNSGTFTVKFDITSWALSDATNPGYWTRVASTNKEGANDCKILERTNDGKAITIGSRTYTLVNKATADKKYSWGCLGFNITQA
jgi:hypothetical protein